MMVILPVSKLVNELISERGGGRVSAISRHFRNICFRAKRGGDLLIRASQLTKWILLDSYEAVKCK